MALTEEMANNVRSLKADRDRYLNARGAIDALLDLNVIPIINENDTVSVDELRFSDNDQLAAMVANLTGADLLVLLTDVEGVLDHQGNRVSVANDVNDVVALVRPPTDDVGLGGMAGKLEAARRATRYGVPVIIGDARDPDLLEKVLAGVDVGTLILPTGTPLAMASSSEFGMLSAVLGLSTMSADA